MVFVVLHVTIVLASIGSTTFALFRPSARKLRVSYALIGLTFASGTYLVIRLHAPMLSSCFSGLVYLGAATVGNLVAHRRLAMSRIVVK